jgi:hypothetical protein
MVALFAAAPAVGTTLTPGCRLGRCAREGERALGGVARASILRG